MKMYISQIKLSVLKVKSSSNFQNLLSRAPITCFQLLLSVTKVPHTRCTYHSYAEEGCLTFSWYLAHRESLWSHPSSPLSCWGLFDSRPGLAGFKVYRCSLGETACQHICVMLETVFSTCCHSLSSCFLFESRTFLFLLETTEKSELWHTFSLP